MDDLELLGAYAADGDQEAIRALVHKHRAMVLATCRRYSACDADAEDAMQEVFLSLLEHAGTIKSNVGGWLRRCAVNAALLTARSRARRTRWEIGRARASGGPPDGDPAARDEHLAILATCLTELPPADRKILLGNCVDGQTQQAIASSLGVTQQAVAKRLGKTLAMLRRKLTSRGVILSLVAGVGLLGKRVARAAIPQAMRALGGLGHGLSAASGGTALGVAAKLKLTVAAILVVSAAGVYRHGADRDLSRPAPDGRAAAAVSPAGLAGGDVRRCENGTAGPIPWAMPGAGDLRAGGPALTAATPVAGRTIGQLSTQADARRALELVGTPVATAAEAPPSEARSGVWSSARAGAPHARAARRSLAFSEAGTVRQQPGEEDADSESAERSERAKQVAPPPKEPPGRAGEPPVAAAGERPATTPPLGRPAEQPATSYRGHPAELPAGPLALTGPDGDNPCLGHELPGSSGGAAKGPDSARIAGADAPQGVAESPRHPGSPLPTCPPPQDAPAWVAGKTPDAPPGTSGRPNPVVLATWIADPASGYYAAVWVSATSVGGAAAAPAGSPGLDPSASPPADAASAVKPDLLPAASAVAGEAYRLPTRTKAWAKAGAAGEAILPVDSLAAAVLGPAGSACSSAAGGSPNPLAGAVDAASTWPLSMAEAGATLLPPPAQTPWQAADPPVDPGSGRLGGGVLVYLPAPLLDGGPPPAAAGGLQDKPADAPGKWGEYAPPPTQGAGGDWEYVISPAAGDFATLARPAPEPTTAIALLTCLPILLRRRGGHGR